MFLLNSRLGLFSAPGLRRDPFSRSYGVNLPSSLTRGLSSASRDCPQPTSVGLRYGHPSPPAPLFWSGSRHTLGGELPPSPRAQGKLSLAPSRELLQRSPCGSSPRPGAFIRVGWYRTINRFSIAYGVMPVA